MPANHSDLEKRLWDAADQLRANSRLKSSEYSVPVLGLIFLRYADHKFTVAETEIKKHHPPTGRRAVGKTDYQARGVMYLPNTNTIEIWGSMNERRRLGGISKQEDRSLLR